MQEIVDFFKGKMFFIATLDKEDQPRVRPFGQLMLDDDHLYFNTGKHKAVYQQLIEHPKVELCAFDKGTWFRVAACAIECDEMKLKEKMMSIDPFVKKTYGSKLDDLAIFKLTKVQAYRCSFKGNEKVYEEK